MRYTSSYPDECCDHSCPQDRLVRLKPNQVLCSITGCCKGSLVFYRFLGSTKPARLVYCQYPTKQLREICRFKYLDS